MGEASAVAETSAVAVTSVEAVATSVAVEVAGEMHEAERPTEVVVTAVGEAGTNRLTEDEPRTNSRTAAT